MSSQPKHFVTPEEYLELERKAEYKNEYFNGEIFAMSGASPRHGVIVANLIGELRQHFKGKPCQVYPSDLRLRISTTGLYKYPDITVVCGELQFADDQKDTLINPVVLIEVLSPSTQDYDRGGKFGHYRALPSLQEYLTVAQAAPHVEHHTRQAGNRWLLAEYANLGDSPRLSSLDLVLPLAEIYDKVQFDA